MLLQTSHNLSADLQINCLFVRCIHVEEAVIYGKELRSWTHKRDNSGSCVIISEEHAKSFDLENEGQGQGIEERDLRHLIGYI